MKRYLGILTNGSSTEEVLAHGKVEAEDPLEAQDQFVREHSSESEQRGYLEGGYSLTLYEIAEEYDDKRLAEIHHDKAMEQLSQVEPPEEGWAKGSDMDRL